MSTRFFQRLARLRIFIGAAVLLLTLILFAGRDFGWIPRIGEWFARFQAGPALLRLATHPVTLSAIAIAGAIIMLTLLFGRVYCSYLCPLGAGQDFIAWLLRLLRLRRRDYGPLPRLLLLRLSILLVVIGGIALGVILPALLLDPYAISGRIMSTMFKPLLTAGNNQAVHLIGEGYVEQLAPVTYSSPAWPVTIIAALMFLTLIFAVWRWGRIYCNSICPVGTFLSLLSRVSLYKLEFAQSNCRNCRKCLNTCKAGCIDLETKKIDFDRCVLCFNCGTSCKFDGLRWVRRTIPRHLDLPQRRPKKKGEIPASPDRRNFLAAAGTLAAGAVFLPVLRAEQHMPSPTFPIMPPGAGDFDRLASRCVGCHLCVEACPSKVIRPATTQYGLSGFMLPRLDFHTNMCEFDCTICSNVCPSGALLPLTTPQKHLVQIGKVKYYPDRCVVPCDHNDCGACAEHCPTQAVTMKPWKDGLKIPVTDVSICIGCGCCEYVCPVRPQRAIVVEGIRQHGAALPPPKQQAPVKVKDDGFLF